MQTLTTEQLRSLFLDQRGNTFLTVTTRTPTRVRKDCPWEGVVTVASINGAAGTHYEAAVNRQRAREGNEADFQAKERGWGIRIEGTPLVEHKGKCYLTITVRKTLSRRYLDAGGQEISPDAIAPYLYKKSSSRQGLDKEVVVRDISLENIVGVTMNSENYVVVHNKPQVSAN